VVLVVEDEPLIRIDLADYLASSGFDVLEAAHADEALNLLERRDDIRVLVTDVDMPGSMDGLMLAHMVADRWPPVRIVVVSGHLRVGVIDIPEGSLFFSKPYHQPDLVASMRELLT
jgi:CheY-like chemotaxis protein